MILVVFIAIVIFIVIIVAVKHFGAKDTMRTIGLMTSIRNTGYDSSSTILVIHNTITSHLKKEGFKVIGLNVVHEKGGRYQGMLQTEEEGTTTLRIIADASGNLQWSVVED